MKFEINQQIRLKSFLGVLTKDKNTDETEDYWKLIGQSGIIIKKKDKPHPAFLNKGLQVLVKFNCDINHYNLISHNEKENSLWIFESDLALDF